MLRPAWDYATLIASLCIFGLECSAEDDWPQWGGSGGRNNVADVRNLPADWAPGKFDRRTGRWDSSSARNIKWVATLGSQTWGTPVIADGRVFVGTNNMAAQLKRYPREVDLGCLLCFGERDGKLLWQFSAEKLPTGREHDMPFQGIASSPLVEKDRAWFVSNRGEVVCVDTQGFSDGEDDGPTIAEVAKLFEIVPDERKGNQLDPLIANLDRSELPADLRARFAKASEPIPEQIELRVEEQGRHWSFSAKVADVPRQYQIKHADGELFASKILTPNDTLEADVICRFDMMKELGSRQHNLATCCITSWKDTLFVCTGNGVDQAHSVVPAPEAPSFFAMDKHTGAVLWTSNLPGANIHHGQWSAPAVGVLGGVPQVIFCGGDGWVYSFHAEQWKNGQPQLLWKFDTNAKDAILELGGRGTRNEPIAPPVLHENKVYVTTGQDPEHGEGPGCIWCIDPARKLDGSDVSAQKVVDEEGKPVPPRRTTNLPAWKEFKVWNSGWERDLDRGVVHKDLREQLRFERPPLPAGLTVKVLTPGAEWELSGGSGERQETLYVWKRWHVNEAGERDVRLIVARRNQERIVENPDSAVVWKYEKSDWNGDGKIDKFYEVMHRAVSSVVIHDGLLFCPDFSGLLHCLDAKTGKPHWTCDLMASCWCTPLIADGRLFVSDEDGDVAIFRLSADPAKAGTVAFDNDDGEKWLKPATEVSMPSSVYCNPVAANGVLYIAAKDRLFAVETEKRP